MDSLNAPVREPDHPIRARRAFRLARRARHSLLGSLRTRLILLVTLSLLPVFGLVFIASVFQTNNQKAEVKESSLRMARLLSANQEQAYEGARQLLITLARSPQIRGQDWAACNEFLSGLHTQYPDYALMSVANLAGDMVCSSMPLENPVNVRDRAYFNIALNMNRFAVGEFHIGRVTKKSSIGLAYPVLNALGKTEAIVFISYNLESFKKVTDRVALQLPPGARVLILDQQGVVLLDYPGDQNWQGRSISGRPVFNMMRQGQEEGKYEGECLESSEECLFAFHRPNPSPDGGYVLVSMPERLAFATINQAVRYQMAGVALVGLLAVIGAWFTGEVFLIRKMRVLSRTTQLIAEGQLGARTGLKYGPGELSQLAAAFDRMAESLEQRDHQLRSAEAARSNSEMNLSNILQNAFEAIVSVDEDLRIVVFNKGAELIFGYRSDEILGSSLDTLLPDEPTGEDRMPISRHLLADAKPAGEPWPRFEQNWKRKNGQTFPGEASISRMESGGGVIITLFLSDITQRRQAEERVDRQIRQLGALRMIDMAITGLLDLQPILATLVNQLVTQLQVDAAAILLLQGNVLEYAAGSGFRSRSMRRVQIRQGEGPIGQAAAHRQLIFCPDARNEGGCRQLGLAALAGEDFAAYGAVPLVAKSQVKGVLVIFHRAPLNVDQDWRDFLEALSGQAAIAIENATLFEQSKRSNMELNLAFEETIEGWASTLELRHQETVGHSRRVVALTLRLAREMGIREEELVHIRRGAILHDIGKMGIPDSILLKSGPLTEVEWEVMRMHPQYAYDVLSPIPFLRNALDIPYSHHERWDGRGYPQGLKERQIPLSARIFSVVDVWDALREDRVYRPAWSEAAVLDYLKDEAGKTFDPQVVRAFLALLEKHPPEAGEHPL